MHTLGVQLSPNVWMTMLERTHASGDFQEVCSVLTYDQDVRGRTDPQLWQDALDADLPWDDQSLADLLRWGLPPGEEGMLLELLRHPGAGHKTLVVVGLAACGWWDTSRSMQAREALRRVGTSEATVAWWLALHHPGSPRDLAREYRKLYRDRVLSIIDPDRGGGEARMETFLVLCNDAPDTAAWDLAETVCQLVPQEA